MRQRVNEYGVAGDGRLLSPRRVEGPVSFVREFCGRGSSSRELQDEGEQHKNMVGNQQAEWPAERNDALN